MERGPQAHVKHWKFRASPEFFAPPGPLAEQLAPDIARTAFRNLLSRGGSVGRFLSAWQQMEYALNQDIDFFDAAMRRKYISDSTMLLGDIIEKSHRRRSDVEEGLLLQTLTLSSYLPAFTKRAVQEPITQRDCSNIYHSLGVSLHEQRRYLTPREWVYTDGTRFAETITFAASARMMQPELLIWPASPREEGSKLQVNNHDGYFMTPEDKIGVQMKLIETEDEKEYDDAIIMIHLLPILDHACKRAGLSENLSFGESLEFMTNAIIAETKYGRISDQQTRFLDYFCRSLAARYRYAPMAA